MTAPPPSYQLAKMNMKKGGMTGGRLERCGMVGEADFWRQKLN